MKILEPAITEHKNNNYFNLNIVVREPVSDHVLLDILINHPKYSLFIIAKD